MKKEFQRFIDKNKWLQAVPNALTVCNSLCGFLAILNTLQAYNKHTDMEKVFIISSCMILGAMIFDVLDGFAARIFNAASLKGIQMDSLADMVTFGVAPAVLVAVMAHKYSSTSFGYSMAWGLSAIYLAAVAHRLARYNVMTMVEKKSSQKFYGLPSPGGAAAVCSLVFLFCSDKIDPYHKFVKVLPFYAGLLGLLMVSNIRYQHIGKWISTVRRSKLRLLLMIVIILFLIPGPGIGIAVVVNGYVIFGIVSDIYIRTKLRNIRRS